MPKEFKTLGELVELLESRGVETDADTVPALRRESYYAVVNGYRDPYLDREAMTSSSGDVFKAGTKFRWMHALFTFDRDLRGVTFRYLARAEASMRTAVAYAFSNAHRGHNAYLERSSFCSASEYLVPKTFRGDRQRLWARNINDLMRRLTGKVDADSPRAFVRHYAKAYGFVPLWVLANDLTFGNVSHFYRLMKPRERDEVCKIVARSAQRDSRSRGTLSPRRLMRAAEVLTGFRNLCAHDERLYCAKERGADFAAMAGFLGDLVPQREVTLFLDEVRQLVRGYDEAMTGSRSNEVLFAMGLDGGDAS